MMLGGLGRATTALVRRVTVASATSDCDEFLLTQP